MLPHTGSPLENFVCVHTLDVHLVIFCTTVFCEVVCKVILAWMPLLVKCVDNDRIFHPTESHCRLLWSLFSHSAIYNSCSCAVVTVYWCWWLSMDNVQVHNQMQYLSFFGVQEECVHLSFCYQANLRRLSHETKMLWFIWMFSPFLGTPPTEKIQLGCSLRLVLIDIRYLNECWVSLLRSELGPWRLIELRDNPRVELTCQ